MKVLVTGGRSIEPWEAVERRFAELPDGSLLMEGGAGGTDTVARNRGRRAGFHVATVRPLYDVYGGKAAPAIRNRAMLAWEPDLVLAFPAPDSKGTWDCVQHARARGIEVEVVEL